MKAEDCDRQNPDHRRYVRYSDALVLGSLQLLPVEHMIYIRHIAIKKNHVHVVESPQETRLRLDSVVELFGNLVLSCAHLVENIVRKSDLLSKNAPTR